MPHLHPILASDDGAIFKIIFWLVVGLIWLIVTIVKGVAKAMGGNQQAARRSATSAEAPIDLTPTMEVRPPAVAPQLWQQLAPPPVAVAPPPLPTAKRGKKVRRPAERLAAQAVPVQQRQAQQASIASALIASATARPTPSAPAPVTLTALQQAVRPESLRRELVLLEILGKPLSLRDNQSHPS